MSTASKISTLAAEDYERNLAPDRREVRVFDWMWRPEGLDLRGVGGAAIGLYARIYSATSPEGGMYFESAARSARALGYDRKTIVRARRALEGRGVIKRVGVQILDDGSGSVRLSRSADPSSTVNGQCAWIVDATVAREAAKRVAEASGTPGPDGGAEPALLAPGLMDDTGSGPANPGDIGHIDGADVLLGTVGSRFGTNGNNESQNVDVAPCPAKSGKLQGDHSRHHLPTCGNADGERGAVKMALKTSSSYNPKKTGGVGEEGRLRAQRAFERLVNTWPNRKASKADFGAYLKLLEAGYEPCILQLGAEAFAAWSARRGKTPRAPLAWFLRQGRDGKPNPFVASAARRLRKEGAAAKPASREDAGPSEGGPYAEDDLSWSFVSDEQAWDVSTPGGYRARIYPSWPLNRPDADRKVLAEALTAERGEAWKTFVGATESDVEFEWSDSAAWGGCWVAKARNGFTASMHGPRGVDRQATKKQLVDEFNGSHKLYRSWREHSEKQPSSDVRMTG